MALSGQLKRLGKHSAIYGLGGLVSRILAVLLLPLYTHYLSTSDYGQIETLIALVTVLTIVLQFGIGSAFFRFYFDADDHDGRRLVLRTSFWFTMTMATLGLVLLVAFATPIAEWLFDDASAANLVRASAVALWAQLNYMQLTNLFRVEERSVAFVLASLSNVLLTVGATLLLVVVLDKGPQGVIVGNFAGTLVVYLALLGYRREQLGLQLSWPLLRRDEPLRAAARPLGAVPLGDELQRPLLPRQAHGYLGGRPLLRRRPHRLGDGAPADRVQDGVARVRVLDQERRGGKADLCLGAHLPRRHLDVDRDGAGASLALARRVARRHREFASASRVVGPLAFAAVSFGGFIVLSIGIGRARRTQFNWVDHGGRRRRQRGPQPGADPALRDDGRRRRDRRRLHRDVRRDGVVGAADLPCPYQWRRVLTAAAAGVALAVAGQARGRRAAGRVGLIARLPARAPARSASTSRPSASGCARSSSAPEHATRLRPGASSPAARIAGDRKLLVDLAGQAADTDRPDAAAVVERRDAAEEEAEERIEARKLGRRAARFLGELPRREGIASRSGVGLAVCVDVGVARGAGHRDGRDDFAVSVDDDDGDRAVAADPTTLARTVRASSWVISSSEEGCELAFLERLRVYGEPTGEREL